MFQSIDTNTITQTVNQTLTNLNLEYTQSANSEYAKTKRIVYQIHSLKDNINGDEIVPTLRITNANDGKQAFTINLGAFRYACSNGLVVSTNLYSEKIIHIKGKTLETKIDSIPEKIVATVDTLQSELFQELQELAMTKIELEQGLHIIGNLNVPKKVKDNAIYNLFNPKRIEDEWQAGNLWGLWNTVNESIRTKCKGDNAIKMNDGLLQDIQLLAA